MRAQNEDVKFENFLSFVTEAAKELERNEKNLNSHTYNQTESKFFLSNLNGNGALSTVLAFGVTV